EFFMKSFNSLLLAGILSVAAMPMTLLPAQVMAQDINLLPEGQTLITLSVTERGKVEQDTLIATLRIERENRDSEALQSESKSAMTQALAASEDAADIKVSTGYYSVYQYSNAPQGGRTSSVWRGSQSVTLEGKDSQQILELAGELQGMGFVMNNLQYTLSTERADEVRDGLMESAIARATANAERAAAAMGKANIDIATLDIDAAMGYSQPYAMARMSTSAMAEAAPVADAGESEVSLTVRIQAVAQ